MGDIYEDIQRKRAQANLSAQLAGIPDDFNLEPPQAAPQATPSASTKGTSTGMVSDIGKGVVKAGYQAGTNLFNAIDDAGNWLNENVINLRTASQQKASDELKAKGTKVGTEMFQKGADAWTTGTTANQVTADVGEFLIGFIPLFRAERAFTGGVAAASGIKAATSTVGKLGAASVTGAVAGAGASATTVSPDTANLSSLVETHFPSLSNPITQYLQISPEDSSGEKRLKQALDSVLGGVVTGPLIEGMFMAVKGFKASKVAQGATDGGAKEFGEAIQFTKEATPEAEANKILKGSNLKLADEPSIPGIDFTKEVPEVKSNLELGDYNASPSKPIDFAPMSAEEKASLNTPNLQMTDNLEIPVINFEKLSQEVSTTLEQLKDHQGVLDLQIPKGSELDKLIPEGHVLTQPELTAFQEAMKSQRGSVDPTALAQIMFGSTKGEIGSSLAGGVAGYNMEDENAPMKDKLMMAAVGSLGGRMLFRMKSPKEIQQFRKENPVTSVLATREGLDGIAPKEFNRLPPKTAPLNKDRLAMFGEKIKAGHFDKITPDDTAELGALIRNIDSEDDIEKLMTMTAQVFDKDITAAKVGSVGDKATGKRTWEEARQASEGLNGIKTINDLYSKTKYLDSQVQAARATITASAGEVLTAAKILRDLEGGVGSFVSVEERAAALNAASLAFDKVTKIHGALQAKVMGSSSEIARALAAHRAIVKGEQEMASQLSALVSAVGGRDTQLAMAKALEGITDPRALNAALGKNFLSRTIEAALYVRLTGILWSPITQTRNILGNTMRTIATPMEGLLEAGIAGVRGTEGGKTLGEVKTESFGLLQGLKDAVSYLYNEKKFGEGFYKKIAGDEAFLVHDGATKAGETKMFADNPLGNLIQNPTSQTGQHLQQGLDRLGSAMGANLHFMGATDKFFQALNYRMSLNAQAYRNSLAEGFAPNSPEFSEHLSKLIDTPSIEMEEQAMKLARESTFQQNMTEGGWLDTVGSWVNQGRNQMPLLSLLVPFVKTPTNILKYVGSRTPLLSASPLARQGDAVRAIIAKGGPEADRILAQWSFGSMMLASAATLAYEGFIVGGSDGFRDKSGNLQNSQNYALKIGDQTYKIDGLDPIGMFFGMAADVVGALKRDDEAGAGELIATGLLAATKYTMNKSYMQGIFEGTSVLNDIAKLSQEQGQKKFSDYVAQMSTSFMPFGGASNWAAKQIDPTTKSYNDWKDRWLAKIPIASQQVYAKRNVLTGEVIKSEGALGPDMISPLTSKTLDNSPSVKELVRLGVNVDYPNKALNKNIQLTPEQYDRLQVLATQEVKIQGKTLKESLDTLVTSPRWESYPDGQDGFTTLSNTKESRLKGLIETYRDRAEKQLIRESSEVKDQVVQNKSNKVKARRGLPIEPLANQQ